MDYREYGAAPLIGLNGLGMVAHGSSDGKAITSSILLATRYVEGGLMPKLREAFGANDSESSKEGAGL
jgi:glycerol-3-phosphate acyltransferase PlsX